MNVSAAGAQQIYSNGIKSNKASVARNSENGKLQLTIAEDEKDVGILINLAHNTNLFREAEEALIERNIPRVNNALLRSRQNI